MSTSAPSRAQIALALTVLKSKPASLILEEYIQNLRSVVINRVRRVPTTADHYIDGTLFWKRAYEKSELENSKLLDKVFELEQTIQRSEYLPQPRSSIPTTISEKGATNKANTQTKRRKVEGAPTDENHNKEWEFVLATGSLGCRTLLRALFALQSNIKNPKTPVTTLIHSITSTSQIVGMSLETLYNSTRSEADALNQRIRTEDVTRIIFRHWIISLNAVEKMEKLKTKNHSECVPGLAHIFQKLLGQLQQYCLDEADRQIKSSKNKPKRQANTISPRSNIAVTFDSACKAISRTCCQMLAALNLKSSAHCSIFEGMMCILLDHIGSSLSLVIFVEPGVSIKSQEHLLPPQGLLDVSHIDSDTALLTTQVAAPYIILILQRAMIMSHKQIESQQSKLLQLRLSGDHPDDNLMTRWTKRLQNTLLRGVFGDEDTIFHLTLKRPRDLVDTELDKILSSIEQDRDKSEWFIGQVWEHLGWDVLLVD